MKLLKISDTEYLNRDHISRFALVSADDSDPNNLGGDAKAEQILEIYVCSDVPVRLDGEQALALFKQLSADNSQGNSVSLATREAQ